MARAPWGLALLALPAAMAPLVASGLSLGGGHSPGAQRKVLLVVAGLSRHMEVTWPLLEQSVILPNERAGYAFTIVFSTNAGLECHQGSPTWHHRKCEEPTDDRESHIKRIKGFIAPRTVSVIDDVDTCAEQGAAEGMSVPWKVAPLPDMRQSHARLAAGSKLNDADETGETLDDAFGTLVSCTPWWKRVHRVVADMLESGKKFDRVVAMRPDVIVHHTGVRPPSGPVVLSLDEMCQEKPGFSFVTASWTIKRRMFLHQRDLDFMHILCPGEALAVYEEALRDPSKQCKTTDSASRRIKVPALPAEFTGVQPWGARAFYCRFVQLWETNNISLSHWDSRFHLTWPEEFCIVEESTKEACLGPGE